MKCAHASLGILALVLVACSPGDKDFYQVEMSGSPVGYVSVTTLFADDEVTRSEVSKETYLKLTLLGRPFDLRIHEQWTLDPTTGGLRAHEMSMHAGDALKISNAWTFEEGLAHFEPRTGGRDSTYVLSPDVLIDDGRGFWFLLEESPNGDGPRTFRQLDLVRGAIHETEYTRRDDERLVFDGRTYDCLVYDAFNRNLGTVARVWIDPEGDLIKLEAADGTAVTKASKGIRDRIRRASIDDKIFADVDTRIEDPLSLRSMRVEATIRSAGSPITVESLNVPGQRFTGTVDRNLIEGVFELEPSVYLGEDPPPFPPGFSDDALRPWLGSELLIESDDPVLVQASRDITSGASDAWEAVTRIAAWVGENLRENVPGSSARQTYDTREGECGSHARLTAALCRASGIPCRLVSGCMYTLIREGSFGQHVWNEVYMGEAGWIPLDTTVDEVGGINAGHVRLGEQVSFNPVRMKILDFESDAADPTPPGPGR